MLVILILLNLSGEPPPPLLIRFHSLEVDVKVDDFVIFFVRSSCICWIIEEDEDVGGVVAGFRQDF